MYHLNRHAFNLSTMPSIFGEKEKRQYNVEEATLTFNKSLGKKLKTIKRHHNHHLFRVELPRGRNPSVMVTFSMTTAFGKATSHFFGITEGFTHQYLCYRRVPAVCIDHRISNWLDRRKIPSLVNNGPRSSISFPTFPTGWAV